jgi:hypothetical protein
LREVIPDNPEGLDRVLPGFPVPLSKDLEHAGFVEDCPVGESQYNASRYKDTIPNDI